MGKFFRIKPLRIGGIWRHSDVNQIVVSKKELMYQLDFFNNQSNLILLLALGQKLPDYSQRLLCAALKYELIGSMFFPKRLSETGKPELKTYVKLLFESHYETPDEVACVLRDDLKLSLSDDEINRVYQKLLFIIASCCPCLADTEEPWWAGTYRPLIEYAVKNDFPQYCGCTSIWDAYNRKVTSRARMLEEMDLSDELIRELALEDYYSLYIMDACPEALCYEGV